MSNRIGYAQIIVCTLAWGTIGSIVGNITLGGPEIAFFRMFFGMVVVLAWLAARGKLDQLKLRAKAPLLIGSGLVLAAHWGLLFEGYKRIGVDSTILIVFLGPVLWAVAAPFVLRERLRAVSVVALAIAFGGIALISVPKLGNIDTVGLLAALGSAILFAALVLFAKLLTDIYEPAAIVVWQQGVGAILISPVLAGASAEQIRRALPLLILLGAVHSGVLGILLFHALRALQAQQIGVLWYLEPASAVLFAWWILGERPPGLTLVGGALIVVAGIAIIVGDRRHAAAGALSEPIVQEVHR
jgi:drug/metabolite transporter (DMT)-like permease